MKGKVLFLHGWFSDGIYKSTTLTLMGYEVKTPSLSNWLFSMAVATAQTVCEKFDPDVIVGSSRGAAVALSLKTDKPLVLLAPAWKQFGSVHTVRNPNSIVIHSPKDTWIPYEDSVILCSNSPGLVLCSAGEDHRMNDLEATLALSNAISRLFSHCHREYPHV